MKTIKAQLILNVERPNGERARLAKMYPAGYALYKAKAAEERAKIDSQRPTLTTDQIMGM